MSSTEFAISEVLPGKLNALVKNIMNQVGTSDANEAVRLVNSGERVLVERNDPRLQPASGGGDNGGISPYVKGLDVEVFIADQREFYRQVHSINMDPSGLIFPPITPGFNWGIWLPQGMTPQRAYEMSEAVFPCWKWNGGQSLDKVIDLVEEVRSADQQYIVWCRDRVEADEELKNLSANQIKERGINTLTLPERLILGQWFYWKSGGRHLDVQNYTLCSGSRYSDGGVPYVYFSGSHGEVKVGGCSPDDRNDGIRSRQAVSV